MNKKLDWYDIDEIKICFNQANRNCQQLIDLCTDNTMKLAWQEQLNMVATNRLRIMDKLHRIINEPEQTSTPGSTT